MSPNRSCGIVTGPERADDPELTDQVDRLARLYEATLKDILTGPGLNEASALTAAFSIAARQIAKTPFEATYARRLELSLELQAFWRFGGDLDEVSRRASEFVELPCHRRIDQCWEMAVFAAGCRDGGRPELGWPPFLQAFRVAEDQLGNQDIWISRRDKLLRILEALWSSISPEIRPTLTPLVIVDHNPH